MNANDLQVKMIIQRLKWQVDVICLDRKLPVYGTKLEQAMRIAEYDTKRSERDWQVISGGRR